MIKQQIATLSTSVSNSSLKRPLTAGWKVDFHHIRRIRTGLWLLWFIVLLIMSGMISISHGADAMWDLKNYHLYNAFESYYSRYSYDIAAAQAQSYLNPFLEYPFFALISLINDYPRAVAFCMGMPEGINLWLISLLAWTLASGRTLVVRCLLTGLAVIIGGTGAGTLPLIGATTGDVTVAIPILASLVILMRNLERTAPSRALSQSALLAAGFLSGAAVGAKPTMGCFAVGLFAALLVAGPLRSLPGTLVRFSIAAVLGVVATGGYHAVRMARHFGSPLFPLFNSVFRSPLFLPDTIREGRFIPKTGLDALSYPFRWATDPTQTIVSEAPFRDIRIALVLSSIGLVVLRILYLKVFERKDYQSVPRPIVFVFAFTVVSYCAWMAIFSVYRYLLPLEMLSGVLMMAGLMTLGRPTAVPPLMVAATAACWATTVPLEWGHTAFREHYIEVDAPVLAPDTLVLIVGDDPVSFLVPFMNPSARWLSLDNNFINPTQDIGLVRRERAIIADHRGPMVVIAVDVHGARVVSTLLDFGLRADGGDCRRVSSNLGGDSYQLCPVRRAAEGAGTTP